MPYYDIQPPNLCMYRFPDELAGKYCGPRDFAALLTDHGTRPDFGRPPIPTDHPSVPVLERLCEIAFSASMRPEEGQYPRIRFVKPRFNLRPEHIQTMLVLASPLCSAVRPT